MYSAPLAAVSNAYHSLVCRDPVRLSGNLPQFFSVVLGRKGLLQMAGVNLLIEGVAGHAEGLPLIFADAAPELDIRHIELRLFFADVLVQKRDESLNFRIVKSRAP